VGAGGGGTLHVTCFRTSLSLSPRRTLSLSLSLWTTLTGPLSLSLSHRTSALRWVTGTTTRSIGTATTSRSQSTVSAMEDSGTVVPPPFVHTHARTHARTHRHTAGSKFLRSHAAAGSCGITIDSTGTPAYHTQAPSSTAWRRLSGFPALRRSRPPRRLTAPST
jgi:hypothetical protein